MAAASSSRHLANPRNLQVETSAQSGPEDAIPVSRDHAVNAKKRRLDAKSSNHEEGVTANVAVVERWFCFVLGVVCVACGVMGILTSHSQGPSSIYFARLGSAYVPILRTTAVACLVLGAILVRRGWRGPDPISSP
jgi:hypothetical protein